MFRPKKCLFIVLPATNEIIFSDYQKPTWSRIKQDQEPLQISAHKLRKKKEIIVLQTEISEPTTGIKN